MHYSSRRRQKSGFTVLELLVAVSVTALLAGMLLNITSQVVSTQTQASSDLETNQVAQFILDRIQEDLHCAVYKNDGNVWLAASIPEDTSISTSWKDDGVTAGKPTNDSGSLRIVPTDWTDGPNDIFANSNNQLSLIDSRFGVAGTFLRFFTQAPELDPDISNTGGARAISYQIIRHGITKASTSRPRYQLFRSDVTTKETFNAGYNLHPTEGNYNISGANGSRSPGNIMNPIFNDADGVSTDFSLASNVIDFGIRAFYINQHTSGVGNLVQIFPDVNASTGGSPPYNYFATNNPNYIGETGKPSKYSKFPEVIDVMIRILSSEGASAISAFEDGLIPPPNGFSPDEYWWELAEKNSEVYVRRIRVFASGI